ncbi:unnamed protein product, partial [Adineta ricciae]
MQAKVVLLLLFAGVALAMNIDHAQTQLTPEEIQRLFDGWFNNVNFNFKPFGKRDLKDMTAEEIQRLFDGWFNNVNFNFKPFGKRDLKDVTPEEIQRLFDGWFNNVNINFKPFGKRETEVPDTRKDWTDGWFSNIDITIPWPFGK